MKKILFLFLMGQFMIASATWSQNFVFKKNSNLAFFMLGAFNGFMTQAFTDDMRDPAIGSLAVSYMAYAGIRYLLAQEGFQYLSERDKIAAIALGVGVGSFFGKGVRCSQNGLSYMAKALYQRLNGANEVDEELFDESFDNQEN